MASASEMGARRITNAWLIDHDGATQRGDFILNADGSWAESSGDEDVLETIDGIDRLITRSFQNWHTHLAMILNRGMGEGLPLMEWLESAIFPVESRLTGAASGNSGRPSRSSTPRILRRCADRSMNPNW